MAKKVGRPTKYKPEYCETVVELGKTGAGRAEIALELGICRKTLWSWQQEHPDFLHAITRAESFSAGWWEKQGRLGIHDRKFNAQAYSLQVRNRFPTDWRDRQSLEHSGPEGGPIEVSVERRVVGAKGAKGAKGTTNRVASYVAGPNGNGSRA